MAVGRLELAEDLRLAENQRVQARGHAEQVLHGVQALVLVDVRGQSGLVLAAMLGPGGQNRGLGVAARHVGDEHLHPVAGGKDKGFAQAGIAAHQKFAEPGTVAQGERLPDFHAGGLMVEPEQVDLLLHRYIARNYGVWAQRS